MNNFYQDTRRERWYQLPFALLLIICGAGALSYVFERPKTLPPPGAIEQRAKEFVQRRIAEHQQKAAAVRTTPDTPTHSVTATPVTAPTKPDHKPILPSGRIESSFFGNLNLGQRLTWFSEFQLPARLQFLNGRKGWLLGTLAIPLIGFAILRRRQRAITSAPLLPIAAPKVEPVAKTKAPQPAASAPNEDEQLFSFYLGEETVEEGSFIETYLKPTVANFRDSVRTSYQRLRHRPQAEVDPMHMLIPPMGYPPRTKKAATQGALFRRAVIKR